LPNKGAMYVDCSQAGPLYTLITMATKVDKASTVTIILKN